MITLESSILTLPKYLQSTINTRCQKLSSVLSGSIFEPNICLEGLDSPSKRFIFSIYFKHKVVQVESGATQIINHQKTLIERIELEIEEGETKSKVDEKDELEKIESFKNSISDLLVNSPFFTHVREVNSPNIGPMNFEANCTQNGESGGKSFLEATWLPAINLGPYTIKIGLLTLPSQEITSLVHDYLSIFSSNLVKSEKIKAQIEKASLHDDSWEVLEDSEGEEEKTGEEKKGLESVLEDKLARTEKSQHLSQKTLSTQQKEEKVLQNEVQEKKIEDNNSQSQLKNEFDGKKEENRVEDPEKKRIREQNKAKFVGRLYEYTEQLKRMSDKKFKRREDSCQSLLNKENNFLYGLTGNNTV